MKRKTIPADKSFAKWRKDPFYRAAYAALEEEFGLAPTQIATPTEATMSSPDNSTT